MKNKFPKIASTLILFFSTFSMFGQEDLFNKISFIQGDSVTQLNKKTETIYLERKPFSIKFFNKKYDSENSLFYSMRVAIFSNPKDTLILKNQKHIDNISFFEPGSGMSPGVNNMYDTIFIKNDGSHYITYESENEKRAYRISEKNDLIELEWKILAANYKEKDFQFTELKLSTLYFVILIDKNLNGTIENDELKIVIAKFK